MNRLNLRLRPATLFGFAIAIGFLSLGYLGVLRLARDEMLRCESNNNDEDHRLHVEYGARVRASIVLLRHQADLGASEWAMTDHLFQLLRSSPVASGSKEVDRWREAPQSPERVAVALKWAEVAADEAAYQAALRAVWKLDYAKRRWPRHLRDDEVRPFRMPAGWTPEDLKR